MRSWGRAVVLVAAMGMAGASAFATSAAATAERSYGARQLEVLDLGTLPGGSSSEALGVNDRGWVVGWSEFGDGRHAFLWRDGRMTDLGLLGGSFSVATAINDRGEIVGDSTMSTGGWHAFLWREGRMTDLGTLGGPYSTATAINDRGEIAGHSTTSTGELHAFLWRDGRMTDLGTVEGSSSSAANAINDRGQVFGDSGGAAVWRRGRAHPLPTLAGSEFGSALGANDRGDAVGYAGFPTGLSANRAVVWRDGGPTDLGLGSGNSQAKDINNRGQIVGWRELAPMGSFGPFLWNRGAVTNLPSLTGAGGVATAINDRGEIVGRSPVPGDPFGVGHAVLWR